MTVLALTTPDTTNFLLLGLVAFFGLLLLFLASLLWRVRNLHKDEALVEQLKDDQ